MNPLFRILLAVCALACAAPSLALTPGQRAVVFGQKPAVVWTPKSIPNLALWLDASDASTITASSGAVSAWTDKSDSALTAVQATTVKMPTVSVAAAPSGRGGIAFNGSNGLQIPAVTLPTSITVFVAGSFASGNGGLFLEQGATFTYPGFHVISSDGTSLVNRGGAYWFTSGDAGFGAAGRPSLYDWTIGPGGLAAKINGGLMPAGAKTGVYPGESNATNSLNIGMRDYGQVGYTIGTLYEIIIYKSVLSDAEAAIVRDYLGNKWGVYAPTISAMSYSIPRVVDASNVGSYPRFSPHAEAVFTTSATSVSIDAYDTGTYASYPTLSTYGIYVNGVYNQTVSLSQTGISHLTASLPAGAKTVAITEGGVQSGPSGAPPIIGNYLIAIAFDKPAAAKISPAASKNVVVYADSIAMGQPAVPINQNAWIEHVRAGWSGTIGCVCWGYRSLYNDYAVGSIASVVADIQSQNPTHVWLAIGTNDYGLNLWTAADFGTQYAALLDAIHAAMPAVTVYAQTPIVRSSESANGLGSTLPAYRAAIATAVSTRTSFATLVDGTAFLTAGDLSDGVHPTTAGHATYASKVLAILPP